MRHPVIATLIAPSPPAMAAAAYVRAAARAAAAPRCSQMCHGQARRRRAHRVLNQLLFARPQAFKNAARIILHRDKKHKGQQYGMTGVDGFDCVTWQEMEKRLPDVLASISTDQPTSFKYDKGETFYACQFCNYDINKNKRTATAEIFCCGQYEDAYSEDGFQLKNGCICYMYDGGASDGKPKKYKTVDTDGRKKNMNPDGVEGPEKVHAACIKNAVWRSAE